MKSLKLLKQEFGHFEIYYYEEQNKEYEGLLLTLVDQPIRVRSRLAKKTPKKSGYFVAFWEKDEWLKNRPFQAVNSPEKLAVIVCDEEKKGIFVIPKKDAITHHILTNENQIGKMAMRFYPPWCDGLNNIAKTTQNWQLNYFKDYSEDKKETR